MERYQGKKVVISGGTSGMELAMAMLLDRDARVLVTGRSKAGLESAQKELGKDAIVFSGDALIDGHRHARLFREGRVRRLRPVFVNAGSSMSSASREHYRGCLR